MDRLFVARKTVSGEIRFSGVGIHSGRTVDVKLAAAPEGSGITFVRTDVDGDNRISIAPCSIRKFPLGSCVTNGVARVITLEHFMATLSVLGITDAVVTMNGEEMPILDGSASGYLELFQNKEIRETGGQIEVVRLPCPVWVSNGESYLMYEPADRLTVSYYVDYKAPMLGKQHHMYRHSFDSFVEEISRARTFCFFKDVEAMQERGLALGGTLENALVIYDDRYSTLLRYENEPVRHKILDLIGDLYLLGKPLAGHLTAIKSSHSLNGDLVEQIDRQYQMVCQTS